MATKKIAVYYRQNRKTNNHKNNKVYIKDKV